RDRRCHLRVWFHHPDAAARAVVRVAGQAIRGEPVMSSPVSSGGLFVLQECLEGAVLSRVVGDVVLPAVPDDVEPGAGQDAHGVGVVVTAGASAAVEVLGPGVCAAGVGGEVGDGVAQVFVARPSESDRTHGARLAGGGGDASQACQCLGGGESAATVADFGEKLCGSDLSGPGQAGEDVRIGVRGELVGDLIGQGLDLFDEGAQGSDQCVGDVGVGGAVFAGDTAGRGGQPGVQDGGTLAAGVADLGQPGAETFGGQPVGAV